MSGPRDGRRGEGVSGMTGGATISFGRASRLAGAAARSRRPPALRLGDGPDEGRGRIGQADIDELGASGGTGPAPCSGRAGSGG